MVVDLNGNSAYRQAYAPTKAEAADLLEKKIREYIAAGLSQDAELSPNMPVGDLAALWLEEKRTTRDSGQLAWNSFRLYELAWKTYLAAPFGKLRLNRVDSELITKKLAAISNKNGPGAAKTCRSVLSGIFARATGRRGGIVQNPVAGVKLPVRKKKRVDALSEGQLAALRSYIAPSERRVDENVRLAVEIQLGTGLRIGEVCGLKWDHVGLDRGVVFVEHTVIRKTGEGLALSDVKVSDSERWLFLPSYLVQLLKEHKDEFETEDGMVLHSPTGALLDPVHAQRDLRAVFSALGWEGVTSHVLRRTAATRLIQAGRPVTEVAAQLGHRGVATTIRSYIAVSQLGPSSARDVLEP